MTYSPTPEQAAIVEAGLNTTDNLIVSALAGAAKTSTLLLLAQAIKVPSLMLAFNKKIADELKERMPEHVTCSTLNSLGHRAWGQALGGKRLILAKDKCADILRELINEFPKSDQEFLWEVFPDLLRAMRHAKGAGHVPDSIAAVHKCTPLMDDTDLIASLDENVTSMERTLLITTLERSMEMAFEGTIDFDDQILMPTLFRALFPLFPLVYVDEAQDLSVLNHLMLAKVALRRLIAVGDQCQAIYAFRGAHESGMGELRDRFKMRELTLTTTFRCPPAVVEHVRWRAPAIKAWEGHALEGEVRHLSTWSLEDVPDDAAVICRNNAPLFSLAIAFLKEGRYPKLHGNDIGQGLLKVMEKFGPPALPQAAAIAKLREWRADQEKRVKNKALLEDKFQCLLVFLEAGATLGQACDYARTIFRSQGRVNLMTGHKSKGLEFDDVFFLDEQLVRDEGQDPNLRYVICTRAKRRLTYINREDRVV